MHNKFNNRVDKIHPNAWRLFEHLQHEELSFRQKLAEMNCSMKKKINNVVRRIRIQIETLTEHHKQKQITLLEFIHGLSIIIAQKSATAL